MGSGSVVGVGFRMKGPIIIEPSIQEDKNQKKRRSEASDNRCGHRLRSAAPCECVLLGNLVHGVTDQFRGEQATAHKFFDHPFPVNEDGNR